MQRMRLKVARTTERRYLTAGGMESQCLAASSSHGRLMHMGGRIPPFLARLTTTFSGTSRPTTDLTRALQHYCMISIPVSKRGTITLPPDMRRKLGLDAAEHPMMLVELRDGGIFLQPAEALPVRDIPEETLRDWIAEDETDAESIWRKAGKA